MRAKSWLAKFLPRLLPAFGVILVYIAIGGRPISNELALVTTQWGAKAKAVDSLEQQTLTLDAQLTQHQNKSELSKSADVGMEPQRLVAVESNSSPQAFANLLEIFERHRIRCTGTTCNEEAAPQDGVIEYAFEMTGAFNDVKDALAEIVDALPQVAPAGLHLRRQSNGNCHWEIRFQLENTLQ